MWKAFRDMKEEGREEGLKLGLAEGESKKEKEPSAGGKRQRKAAAHGPCLLFA